MLSQDNITDSEGLRRAYEAESGFYTLVTRFTSLGLGIWKAFGQTG